jgi:hypothetical protein
MLHTIPSFFRPYQFQFGKTTNPIAVLCHSFTYFFGVLSIYYKENNHTRKINYSNLRYYFFFRRAQQPIVGQGFLTVEASRSHSFRHTTLGRAPLDEWSARRRDLWQHTTLIRDRHPCLLAGFEPTIPSRERPQTHTLDHAATGIGFDTTYQFIYIKVTNDILQLFRFGVLTYAYSYGY